MEFFSEKWWEIVITEFNKHLERIQFSKLGRVAFICTGYSSKSITIDWNLDGDGKVVESKQTDKNIFEASEDNWKAFIRGEFKATTGVLKGTITFRGNIVHILPYSNSFDFLARIAKPYL